MMPLAEDSAAVHQADAALIVFAWDLQVLGCSKGVLATIVSITLFGNQISRLGAMGYSITISGVLGYGLSKHSSFNTLPTFSISRAGLMSNEQ